LLELLIAKMGKWVSVLTVFSAVGLVILIICIIWSYSLNQAKYPADVGNPNALSFPLPSIPSAVLLPLVSVTGVDKDILLADKITKDLNNVLAQIPELFLIANQSSNRMRGVTLNLKSTSEKLGVQYLITGSLERIKSQYRLFIRVIDMFTGETKWADNFDEPQSSFSNTYPSILRNISVSLDLNLSSRSNLLLMSGIAKHSVIELSAKADLLESKGDYLTAKKVRRKNMDEGPNFFNPHWELSVALMREKKYKEAYLVMKKALRLNPLNAPRLLSKFSELQYCAEMPLQALQTIEKTLQVRPDFQEAHLMKIFFLTSLKYWSEAKISLSKLLKLYPSFKLSEWLKRTDRIGISCSLEWRRLLVEAGTPE
jgi:TolB-like protein